MIVNNESRLLLAKAQIPVLHSTALYNWLQISKGNNSKEISLALFCPVLFLFSMCQKTTHLPKAFFSLAVNK